MKKISTLIGGNIEQIQNWMKCDACGHGAYWHGFDEKNNPQQRCSRCNCPAYKRSRTGRLGEAVPIDREKGS